jgi:hypothetical protein
MSRAESLELSDACGTRGGPFSSHLPTPTAVEAKPMKDDMDRHRRPVRERCGESTRSWRRALPAGGRDALRQLIILVTAFALYDIVRIVSRGREVVALGHSQSVIDAEKALRIYWEPAMQRAILDDRLVVESLNWFYARVHVPAIFFTLVLIYLYRNESWRRFRNAFLIMDAIGLAIFVFIPLAPPRLVPGSGMIDTKFLYAGESLQGGVMSFVTNPYAAMPSLHFGYALFTAVALWTLWPSRLARVVAIAYPVAVLASIVLTGNHYFLDALAGAAVLAVALAVVRLVPAMAPRQLVPVSVVNDDVC